MAEALAGLPAILDRDLVAKLLTRAEVSMVSAMVEAAPDAPPKT